MTRRQLILIPERKYWYAAERSPDTGTAEIPFSAADSSQETSPERGQSGGITPESQLEVNVYKEARDDVFPELAVYEDLSYRIDISGLLKNDSGMERNLHGIDVYVNEDQRSCFLQGSELVFTGGYGYSEGIFRQVFGFARISISLRFSDGSTEKWHSEPLSVLVRKSQKYNDIRSMLGYVQSNYAELLDNLAQSGGSTGSGTSYALGKKVAAAEKLLNLYRNQYGFFRANARNKVRPVDAVDDVSRVQMITEKSIQHLAEHPSLLKESHGLHGIRVGAKRYLPEKLLTRRNVYTPNVYENQVIVGFLRKIIFDLKTLGEQLESMTSDFTAVQTDDPEYIHSYTLFVDRTYYEIQMSAERIRGIIAGFEKILVIYSRILPVSYIDIKRKPEATACFKSVPQYHEFFIRISDWLRICTWS